MSELSASTAYGLPILLVDSWTGKIFFFPCTCSRLRIWSCGTGSANPSRVSPLIFHIQGEFGASSRDPSRFHPGVLLDRQSSSGQSLVYRVTQMRSHGVHRQESASTGPVVLKIVPGTGAAFSGTIFCAPLFSHAHYYGTICSAHYVIQKVILSRRLAHIIFNVIKIIRAMCAAYIIWETADNCAIRPCRTCQSQLTRRIWSPQLIVDQFWLPRNPLVRRDQGATYTHTHTRRERERGWRPVEEQKMRTGAGTETSAVAGTGSGRAEATRNKRKKPHKSCYTQCGERGRLN